MRVRNRLLKKTEYKGRLTYASRKICPCLPCWHPHDCGRRNSAGNWIESFECATNHNSGCSDHILKPIHIVNRKPERIKKGQEVRCKRCGEYLILGEGENFMTLAAYEVNK